jgi:Ras-related protein Rab-1A
MEYDLLTKIVIVGDSSVGKTALINRYCDGVFETENMTTIGFDLKFKTLQSENGKIVKLQIWDTAGQEKFKSIVLNYYRGAHCILLVFDVTNEESFYSIEKWINDSKKMVTDNVMMFLIGTKIDLVDKNKRKVSYEECTNLSKKYNMEYFETSSKKNLNIDHVFNLITNQLVENNVYIQNSSNNNKIIERVEKVPSKWSWCLIL